MNKYLKLMRVHHYLKNLLIAFPLVCNGSLFNTSKTLTAVCGFIAFCLISSSVYIINDIHDIDKDRKHPTKRMRPVASGSVSIKNARMIAACLLIGGFMMNGLIFTLPGTLLLMLYLVLNIGYSYGLKNQPIIDIAILVSGFLIRILYGAVITDIQISKWLYLTVTCLSFYFAFGKRRNELRGLNGASTRAVLKYYTDNYLNSNLYMFLTLAIVFYTFWTMDEKTQVLYQSANLILTVPIVILIVLKYNLDIEKDSDGDPVEVLVHDPILLLLSIFYMVSILLILYL